MEYALRIQGIDKRFPGVHALKNVSFDVRAGSVHSLVGENGAGKSTLMKIISGDQPKDDGVLELFGEQVDFRGPSDSQARGVSMIHQELAVVPYRSVAENIYLGREPRKFGGLLIDYPKLHEQTREILRTIDVNVEPTEIMANLSIAQQQMVEVAKALSLNARVIIMDEPTSSLTDRETEILFRIIRNLKTKGITIIYISHRLEEVFTITDTVTILRDGQTVHTAATEDLSEDEIVRHMVGRELDSFFPKHEAEIGQEVLRVENLTGERFFNASFSVKSGEIVGIAGLVGAGRSEMIRGLMGIDPVYKGKAYFKGVEIRLGSTREMMRRGFAFVPEDRKAEALFPVMSVRDNMVISILERLFRIGIITKSKLVSIGKDYIQRLRIQTPTQMQQIRNLSGGNQQKVIIARCLALNPSVLILDEPTRGIDVGAKSEIHSIVGRLAAQGVGVIMISSELPELLGVADRIIVMKEGRISGEFDRLEATQDAIMQKAAAGGEAS
ncbi:sugar ABC transporter ATP-binding protein [Salinispira pacifica]|uniref:Putative ribose/galactose/methyl galactoside import ATP-binding protein 1 n=1 Tax=Salinispira pacifica TaxID=1307761 RepID=V5WIA5_9SPIO|nr:sugar ABC transporter ATP-binding protein [Salinispira pacifica]AHC14906.1 Putative ribose/galactose/methyl galactoside import ATP-binding protein 1 [Salinispira pacifica]